MADEKAYRVVTVPHDEVGVATYTIRDGHDNLVAESFSLPTIERIARLLTEEDAKIAQHRWADAMMVAQQADEESDI